MNKVGNIEITQYINSHGERPTDDQYGTWYLLNDDGNTISYTGTWKDLVRVAGVVKNELVLLP